MAMNGNTLGNAIGTAFFDAIPNNVKECMTADAKTAMCNSLIANSKIIANCVVAHIISCAKIDVNVTVDAGILVQAGSCTGSTTSTGSGTGSATIS